LIPEANNSKRKTVILTLLALVAFAANSVLCRLALDGQSIDAASFTAIRLISGAVVLFLILKIRNNTKIVYTKKGWLAGVMLFLYASTFSFAYITLQTGTGALILFAAVQVSMILGALFSGKRLRLSEWLGMAVAFSGLVYLVLPGISTPSATGFVLMTIAGIAWGVYSLIGRNSATPLADTARNFLCASPLAVIIAIISLQDADYSTEGIILAIISGAIASGVGYTIWYVALGGISAIQAAVAQLCVPVIAALGGVVFVSEAISLRLTISTVLILGGILTVVLGSSCFVPKK
jgi:drug/metabolite transporter (DMT)-like permease